MTFPAWRRSWNWTGLHQADFLLLVHPGIQICPCAAMAWKAHPKCWILLVAPRDPGPLDLVLENPCWEPVDYSNLHQVSGPACVTDPADSSGLGPFDMSPCDRRHLQAYLAVAYCQVPCRPPGHRRVGHHQEHPRAYHRGRHSCSLKSDWGRPGRLIPCVLGIRCTASMQQGQPKPYD